MDEGRKRALLIAASIIVARRLSQLDFKPCPAYEAAIRERHCRGGENHAAHRLELAGAEAR